MDLNEEELEKICINLIREVQIIKHYDNKMDKTTFTFDFPDWLYNYPIESIKRILDIITPILVDQMDKNIGKKCIGIKKEIFIE